MFKNVIYSVIFHLVIIAFMIFSFSLTKDGFDDQELLVKVEIADQNQLTMLEENNKTNLKPPSLPEKKKEQLQPKNKEKPKKVEDKNLNKPQQNKVIEPKPEKKEQLPVEKSEVVKNTMPKEPIKPIIPIDKADKELPKKVEKVEKPKIKKKPEVKKIKDVATDNKIEEKKPELKNDIEKQDKLEPEIEEEVKEKLEEEIKEPEIEKTDDDIWFENYLALQEKSKNKEFMLAQNSIESLGLSNREKYNLYSQIKGCFKKAIFESSKSSDEKILVRISISKDGYIESDIADLEQMIKYQNSNKEQFAIAVANAKRAIAICNPLRGLPQDKYNVWKEVILEFSQSLPQGEESLKDIDDNEVN